jgi:hypothetical protein
VGILARFIPLLIVALLVFTSPGQQVWRTAVDWASQRAEDWAGDRIEDQQVRERLRAIEPLCDSDFRPDGFEVSEGQAIALTVGKREVSCDRIETEPMDNGTWAVHVDAASPNGCEFSAVIDGRTGEKLEGGGGCP